MPIEDMKMGRARASLLIVAIWAAVYLPALGTPELDGSEGRRILPALSMIETGDWLVPRMGGEPYYHKPPMINWLVAASFLLTGRQSVESARLCSTLLVLASAGLLIWLPGRWPSPVARVVGAIIFLTGVGLIDLGRRAEIDAIYAAMTLMAVFWWLSAWVSGGSRWSLWLGPSLFLVCGMLTKGPLLLLLYYLVVICVLGYSRQMRAMLSIPHAVSVVLCFGVPLIWVMLASRQGGAEQVAAQTSGDIMLRIMPNHIDWARWAQSVLKALLTFMPWLLLVPALWRREFTAHLAASQMPVFKGVRLGMCLGFCAIVLMPGTKPWYVLPVTGSAGILLGWLLSTVPAFPDGGRLWRGFVLGGVLIAGGGALAGIVLVDRGVYPLLATVLALGLAIVVFHRREMLRTPLSLSISSGALIGVLAIQYAVFVLPLDARHDKYRPVAAKINALVPDESPLCVFKPGTDAKCQNLLFYVSPPPKYVTQPRQIDSRTQYLLIREADYEMLVREADLGSRTPASLLQFVQGRQEEFRLLKLSIPPVGSPSRSQPERPCD